MERDDDNPIGKLFTELRNMQELYLASILSDAVEDGIITDSQRNQIIDLIKPSPLDWQRRERSREEAEASENA